MVRGIENEHTKPVKQARLITTEVIKKLMEFHLVEKVDRPVTDTLRAWHTIFRLRLCQSGVMRYDELMRLVRGDITFKTDNGTEFMEIKIRKSKMGRKGLGITKWCPRQQTRTCAWST